MLGFQRGGHENAGSAFEFWRIAHMERRFFLKAMFGVAATVAASSLIGANEALANPIGDVAEKANPRSASTAPLGDLPAADARESYWVRRRRFFRRRRFYYRPRRRVFFYRRRYRRVYFRRRYWW
jgi:hypothetical protein